MDEEWLVRGKNAATSSNEGSKSDSGNKNEH